MSSPVPEGRLEAEFERSKMPVKARLLRNMRRRVDPRSAALLLLLLPVIGEPEPSERVGRSAAGDERSASCSSSPPPRMEGRPGRSDPDERPRVCGLEAAIATS